MLHESKMPVSLAVAGEEAESLPPLQTPAGRAKERKMNTGLLTNEALEKFSSFFEVGNPDDCWIWKPCANTRRYGAFRYGSKSIPAHRLSLALKDGKKQMPDKKILPVTSATIRHALIQTTCFGEPPPKT